MMVVNIFDAPQPSLALELLCATARRVETAQVYASGPGMADAAVWAARQGARVLGWTDNLAEAEAWRATFARHGLRLHVGETPGEGHTCYLRHDFAGLPPASCGLALLHLPRGAALQQEQLALAAALLAPAGRLAFVGATNEGVKTALKAARTLFGQAGIVARKGGYHAGLAQRPPGEFPLPQVAFREQTVVVAGLPTRLIACAGAFAADRLDGGAAALIAGMQVAPGETALDLGCGTGLVGLAALRRGAQVTLADVSARAVESARRTLAANGFPAAPVHLSQGAEAVAAQRFAVVLTNPPFHRGHATDFAVVQQFIRDAARVLLPNGQLYLVANDFLHYAPYLRECFAQVEGVWEEHGFRVWRARRTQ